MKALTITAMFAICSFLAFADTPPTPPVPPVPDVVETCGEGCTRTIKKTRTVETGDAGEEIIREEVEVMELRDRGAAEIDVQVETDTAEATGEAGEPKIRKRVRVVTAGDGELTDEMRAEIDELIAGLESEDETGEKIWHQKGDGVVIIKRAHSEGSEDGTEDARIILRSETTDEMRVRILSSEDGISVLKGGSSTEVEDTVGADGTRTIRVTPETGGETTVITIKTEKSSKNDN